jgi:hypothetical protein
MRYERATAELLILQSQKTQLDAQALRYPDVLMAAGFAWLCGQTALLFYWVYCQFDWNLVEPITYLLGYSVTWLSVAVFFTTGEEFTFDNIRQMIIARRRKKLYARSGFDEAKYEELVGTVRELEKTLDTYSNL